MRGADVRWLRESLRAAQGLPQAPGGNDVYDEDLTRLVQDFQRQHRLNVDGVAGVHTQIVLDTVLNATGSPTLAGTRRIRRKAESMSFILDALRKSEHARQHQKGPALAEVPIVTSKAEDQRLGRSRRRTAGRQSRRRRRVDAASRAARRG